MMAADVLFADQTFPDTAPCLQAAAPDLRIEVGTVSTPETQWAAPVLVPLMTRVTGAVMDRVAGLRLVQQWGAGLEGVDVDAATARGVAVANVPTALTGGAESVAEWCVMSALALGRRVPELNAAMRANAPWGGPKGRALLGCTAGIVGLGGIGKALAARLLPFGMRLVAVTRTVDAKVAASLGISRLEGLDGLSHLLADSDYAFLCLPDVPQTHHIIGAAQLRQMRRGTFLINVGRGGLVDQVALLAAIDEGIIGGCALDVFSPEPLDGASSLLRRPNILATPHIAGVTDYSYERIAQHVAQAVTALRTNAPPANCINWEKVAAGFYG